MQLDRRPRFPLQLFFYTERDGLGSVRAEPEVNVAAPQGWGGSFLPSADPAIRQGETRALFALCNRTE